MKKSADLPQIVTHGAYTRAYARYPTQLARTFVFAKQINPKELVNVVLIIGPNSLVGGTFLFN